MQEVDESLSFEEFVTFKRQRAAKEKDAALSHPSSHDIEPEVELDPVSSESKKVHERPMDFDASSSGEKEFLSPRTMFGSAALFRKASTVLTQQLSRANDDLSSETVSPRRIGIPQGSLLSWRLVVAIFLPLLGLIVLSVLALLTSTSDLNLAVHVERDLEIAHLLSDFLHNSQLERGISGLYMGSNGTAFQQRLVTQRLATDGAISALQVEFVNNPSAFSHAEEALTSLQQQLRELPELRQEIDVLAIPTDVALAQYTAMNVNCLTLVYSLASDRPHPDVGSSFASFTFLLNYEEAVGLERGIGGSVFARGSYLSLEAYHAFVATIADGELLLRQYLVFSTPEQRALFNDTISEAPVLEITAEMRQTLLQVDGTLQIAESGPEIAAQWFGNMTEKIALLRVLDVALLSDIQRQARNVYASSVGLLVGICVILVVTTLATVVTVVSLFRLLRGREQLEAVLFRFLPAQFLALLGTNNVASLSLGDSVSLNLAIVFLDIRDFTSLSEGMSDIECFEWLLQFTSLLSPIIRARGGFIDKFMGDGFLAIFERPGDAIRASIQMVEAVRTLNLGLKPSMRFDVGVGVHYGSVVLGTVGDSERHDGTIISDAVNVSSRLEGLTKQYGCHVVCSGDALHAARPSVCKKLDHVLLGKAVVSGRTQPLELYDLFGADDPLVYQFKLTHLRRLKALWKDFETAHFERVLSECKELREEYMQMREDFSSMPPVTAFGGGRGILFRLEQALKMIADPPSSLEPIYDRFFKK